MTRKAKPKAPMPIVVMQPKVVHVPVFRSAIENAEGNGVDAGYLGLFCVMVLVLGTIPFALILIAIRMGFTPDHALDLVGLAAVIAAATAGFGTAAAGVGLFRMGDKPRAVTTIEHSEQSKTEVK